MASTALLSVHGVRVLGHATARQVGDLYGLDGAEVQEHLLDAEARGWVRRPAYTDGRSSQRELERLAAELAQVMAVLTAGVRRMGVHQPRIDAALARARDGEHRWVDAPEVASMNLVWIQLHEDLLATLGLERGADTGDGQGA